MAKEAPVAAPSPSLDRDEPVAKEGTPTSRGLIRFQKTPVVFVGWSTWHRTTL